MRSLRKINIPLTLITAVAVVALDQITKIIVRAEFEPGSSVRLIGDFVYLTYVQNRGVAFGLAQGLSVYLSLIGLIAFAALYFVFPEIFSSRISWFYTGMITGGAISNLFDRLYLGWVTDFIDLRFWPVFNIADSSVFIGVVIMVYTLIKSDFMEGKRN